MHRLIIIPLLLLAGTASANPYLDQLIQKARQQQLADQDYWHRLVHYKPRRLSAGVRSETDDPRFFLALNGRDDPQAELEATLAAFFRIDEDPATGQPFQCRFIARYHWLHEQLDFDPARLPSQPCANFEAWQQGINPGQVTLVFASDYLNNPSSMFGHTLLRLDPPDQDEDSRLLSYAINYAANTNESNGLVFAVKGLTGGYPGQFSIMPYYEKVKEYNDLENRDLWEYQLTLTPDEIHRMLMHAWELGPINFDYYFLYQNCSFRLLGLLETARPGLDLTGRFDLWAIPTDTVRAVLDEQGLLRKVVYRPAASTILQHQLDGVTDRLQDLAHALALGRRGLDDPDLAALAAQDRARTLEIAYAYLYYLFLGRDVDPDMAKPRMRQLLVARSRVPVSEARSQPPTPGVRPDEGHATARLALMPGRMDGQEFIELRLRPAYHDLLDPAPGYKNGAQINFLDLALRYWPDAEDAELEALTFVDIFSLAPLDRFFRQTSWNAAVGLERQRVDVDDRPLVFTAAGGGGYTFGLGQHALLYASIQTRLQIGDRLPDAWRAGTGPLAALLVGAGPLRVALTAETLWFSDDAHPQWSVRLEPRLALGRQLSLGAALERREDYGNAYEQVSVALRWHL